MHLSNFSWKTRSSLQLLSNRTITLNATQKYKYKFRWASMLSNLLADETWKKLFHSSSPNLKPRRCRRASTSFIYTFCCNSEMLGYLDEKHVYNVGYCFVVAWIKAGSCVRLFATRGMNWRWMESSAHTDTKKKGTERRIFPHCVAALLLLPSDEYEYMISLKAKPQTHIKGTF